MSHFLHRRIEGMGDITDLWAADARSMLLSEKIKADRAFIEVVRTHVLSTEEILKLWEPFRQYMRYYKMYVYSIPSVAVYSRIMSSTHFEQWVGKLSSMEAEFIALTPPAELSVLAQQVQDQLLASQHGHCSCAEYMKTFEP